MKKKNVILTGFMGTGKSTVGRILAKLLNYKFADTDTIIEERENRSISAIFREEGQAYFRRLESETAHALAQVQGHVISTGGRLMLDEDNAAALEQTGAVFCLTAPSDVLYKRLKRDIGKRPLLDHPQPQLKIQEILTERAKAYGRFAQIQTGSRPPKEVAQEIQFLMDKEILPVTHPSGHYNAIIGSGLLPRIRQLANIAGPLTIITDNNIGPHYAHLCGPAQCVINIPAGEDHKNLSTVAAIYDQLLEAGIDRQGTIAALGGGVIGDISGFAAATYLRGIEFIQCPTSLLAMVDASVGGKTGVDLPQGKNLVGAFKQPKAVLIDLETLSTLPEAEFAAGMAELIKAGLIADKKLFNFLENSGNPQQFSLYQMTTILSSAIEVKRQIVQEDPFEKGRRAVLNLGHTFAHAIEQVSMYAVRHGEAVAMGLVAAAHLSAEEGYCPRTLRRRIESVLSKSGLPTRIPGNLPAEELLTAMSTDKKKAKGILRFILIRDVGDVFITNSVSENAVLYTLRACQEI